MYLDYVAEYTGLDLKSEYQINCAKTKKYALENSNCTFLMPVTISFSFSKSTFRQNFEKYFIPLYKCSQPLLAYFALY
jgi:hypothetical protein